MQGLEGPARRALAAFAALAALLLLHGPSLAQGAAQPHGEPLPAERYFQHPAVLDAKLSPSGKRLALTTSRGSARVSLVVVDLGPTPSSRRAASYKEADVVFFDWAGDDRLVFSVADLQYRRGGAFQRAPGLYAVDADGSRFTRLISRTPTAFFNRGTWDAVGAEHGLLHIPRPQAGVMADEVVVGRYGFRPGHFLGIEPMWLNTRSGATRPMLLPGAPKDVVHWLFDSRGEARLALVGGEVLHEVHWRAPGDKAWQKLAEIDGLQPAWWPFAVTDDGTLYVVRPEGAGGEQVLARFDFQALAPSRVPLLQTPGFDFDGELLQGEPGRAALGVRVHTDAETTLWFDEAMKRAQAAVDKRLPGRVNRVDCRRCGEADMVVLVHSYTDRDPGRWLLYEPASERLQPLATVMEGIDPRRMASVDFQRIKARDGRDLPVWLTLPPGAAAGKPAPAVVLVHGGPWVRGGHWRWEPMSQFLASRGYLVIAPEFRGSTGYGQEHFKAGWKQWGQAMQDDVADALLWAQAQGLADKRACIAGASYGGYATLMGLARHDGLYRCGIAWVGVTDLMLFTKGEFWVLDDIGRWGRRYGLPQLVGDPDKDAALLQAQSPLSQAARIKAPLLLAYGAQDLRVPVEHGERLREALQKAGHAPEWVLYPDEGHGWREESTQADFARRVEAFLQQHLGGKP